MASRIRARPAHAPGPTYTAYTKRGDKLITVGNDSVIRIFTTGSDAEPVNIDVPQEAHTAVAAFKDFFITGAEDGSVCKYSLATNSLEEILYRSTLPIRDVAISRDGQWVAVASDELVVKLVYIADMTRVISLTEQKRPVKHVAYDHTGSLLSVSCSDGSIYVYSVSTEQPQLVQTLDGVVKTLETDSIKSAAAIWHPDGRALAAPTATRSMQVVSRSDWQHHKSFQSGHAGDITAAVWSHNGAMLATAADDRSLTLWNTKTQEIIKTFDDVRQPIVSMSWHPSENILSYANNDGQLYIHTDFVPSEQKSLYNTVLEAAPLRGQPLSEVSGNARREQSNFDKPAERRRAGTPDSLDDILGLDGEGSEDGADDFVVDDDGNGYAEQQKPNGHKRPGDNLAGPLSKRHRESAQRWEPVTHQEFQPGSTPWRGDRRYLCLNLTGFIWTLDQGDHHTITIEFYDRAAHKNVHFTDHFLWDRACLGEQGAAFSCPSTTSKQGSTIYYRPHETWTARTDWSTTLPADEEVTSLSLSSSYIVVTTTKSLVRIYTLFGVPFRIYRSKSPVIASTSWRDYIFTVSNGPILPTGVASLVYSIDNIKRDETCQSLDALPLPPSATLSSIFFSDRGDPCIYDSTGTLLVALHWRTPGQAKWLPLLDTRCLPRLASGRKDETYFPIAVAGEKFHCIILKGGDRYPHFPAPLLSEFPFRVPVVPAPAEGEEDDEANVLAEQFVRHSALAALQEDLLAVTKAGASERAALARREVEADKALLQMLAGECREGEERGMRALEIVGLLRDRSGKMLEAAGKIAARFNRDVLGEKIEALAERRMVGLDDDEDN